MVFGCPISGVISDRFLRSRRKVVVFGTLAYTAIWATIWLTADTGIANEFAAQMAINFLFGFFGGFFVAAYAQIKELYPVGMAGTSTAALNLFPFAGGAILITLAGFIIDDKTIGEFQTLWLIAFTMMIAASVCAFLSVEKSQIETKAEDRAG